jgi:uncharacterized membrane protein
MSKRFKTRFRSDLLAGVLVLVPLGITIWVFLALVNLADGLIRMLPDAARPETYLGFPIPGLGILVTVFMVFLVGFAMRYYAGRRIVETTERLLGRVPLLSGIYQGLKQLVQTLFTQRGQHFRQVVLVEYPRRGLFCLAFVTNTDTFIEVEGTDESDPLMSIFLPTTPNPTSGFYLLVPQSDLRRLDLTVEESFKLIMSAGIVTPDGSRAANRWVPDPGASTIRYVDEMSIIDGSGSPEG